jgi:hypothetical protein
MAAIGKQLKQSVKVFQSLMLYRLLPKVRMKVFGIRTLIELGLFGQSPEPSLLTFVIKSIDTIDASALVVTS